jgi:hypothetical protein
MGERERCMEAKLHIFKTFELEEKFSFMFQPTNQPTNYWMSRFRM